VTTDDAASALHSVFLVDQAGTRSTPTVAAATARRRELAGGDW
jgi:hypothetical protein